MSDCRFFVSPESNKDHTDLIADTGDKAGTDVDIFCSVELVKIERSREAIFTTLWASYDFRKVSRYIRRRAASAANESVV